ncbi:MAG: hypothetical protein IPJ88_10655 [Myxococcales bacterium]|nr:MAG: hypothetical protein IPJ88_10655 [Myxococcales bacterium]
MTIQYAKHFPLLIACSIVLSANCADKSAPPPEYPPMHQAHASACKSKHHKKATPAKSPKPVLVSVSRGQRTPIEGQTPQIALTAPKNGSLIKKGPVTVSYKLNHWELSAKGNHVHLIVDNEPYIALRDVSKPLDLVAVVHDNLGHPLSEGSHVIRTFPSRATHESVKVGTPFAMTVFHYKNKSKAFAFDEKAPLLTYSRPKGCYPAGEPILLDFYLTNVATLAADGMKVKYTIDGTTNGMITSWVPHFIENLAEGEHQIQLLLLDKDDKQVEGMFNDTTRTISVKKTCD